MVYKNFRVNCLLRILLLAASIGIFFYVLFSTALFSLLVIIGLFTIYQTAGLIHYVDKTNRDLTRFFESIKFSDFAQTFKSDGRGASFDALLNAFSEVMNAFRRTRAEKEEHFHYLRTVVQHIGIGLIAFHSDGEVELINTAAKRLLRVVTLKNIKSLEPFSKNLVITLLRLRSGEKALVRVEDEDDILNLYLYATEFKLRGKIISLVSIQNIQSELEEKEIEAWQKLIRVLTHEIMNSITPISSLASTINGLLQESIESPTLKERIKTETLTDIHTAAQTIQKRSQGLLHFVDAYRNLTLIPKPNFQIVQIQELFSRAEKLMQPNIKKLAINFRSRIEPQTLEVTADPELIEQVLINLLLNALQSLEKKANPELELTAKLDGRGRIIVQVKDNGPGISEENLEKIFIPFFSTKEGGSGIGLSLSRQIMRLHNGSISVVSRPESETVFTLKF